MIRLKRKHFPGGLSAEAALNTVSAGTARLFLLVSFANIKYNEQKKSATENGGHSFMGKPIYNRVLIKISGEAMAGKDKFGINDETVNKICVNIKKLVDMGVGVGIVVGGGNFWRGRQGSSMDRTRADHMGMLATVINALGLADALEQLGVTVRVETAIEMKQIAEPYIRNRAARHLEKGRVVIFGCGTGNPFFTTDTAAALRAVEIDADVILLAKNVDAVYDSDPNLNPQAKKFDAISYMDVLARNLKVMDSTATSLCMDNNMKIHVFGINDPENLVRAVCGEKIGTIVS
jgi:uridylate kinase